MSAYICSPEHFKVLAIFAASRTGGIGSGRLTVDPRYIKGLPNAEGATEAKLASIYADTLYQENVRSVRARYPEDTFSSLPGPITKPLHIIVTNADMMKRVYRLSPVAVLKMCDGLEYQSCETEDYRQSVGFSLLDTIRGEAIKSLPGYEDAPWDYTVSESKAA